MSYTISTLDAWLHCLGEIQFIFRYSYLAAHEVLSELRLDFSRKFLLAQVEIEVVHRLE